MRPRARDVTAGGLSRVAAVVASYAESAVEHPVAGSPAAEPVSTWGEGAGTGGSGPLDDLIAKAAVAVEGHVVSVRGLRRRGATYRMLASKSSEDASADPTGIAPRRLDVIR